MYSVGALLLMCTTGCVPLNLERKDGRVSLKPLYCSIGCRYLLYATNLCYYYYPIVVLAVLNNVQHDELQR